MLIEDWDKVLRKAWSVKFAIAAAILSGIEVAVQFVQPAGIPNGVFATFAGFVSVAATFARVMQQKELSGGKDGSNS